MPSSKVAPVKKRRIDTKRLDESLFDESDLSTNASNHQRAANEAILSDAFSVSITVGVLLLLPGLLTLPSC